MSDDLPAIICMIPFCVVLCQRIEQNAAYLFSWGDPIVKGAHFACMSQLTNQYYPCRILSKVLDFSHLILTSHVDTVDPKYTSISETGTNPVKVTLGDTEIDLPSEGLHERPPIFLFDLLYVITLWDHVVARPESKSTTEQDTLIVLKLPGNNY